MQKPYTIKEIAEKLGTTPKEVARLLRALDIKPVKYGSRYDSLYPPEALRLVRTQKKKEDLEV